jgi:Tfp pilus assembly protein PilO
VKKQLKLPKAGKIALIVGGDLVLLLMGWFLLLGPQRATARSIANSTAATQLQIAEAKKPVVPVTPAAVQQPEISTANLYNLAKAMPSTMDTPNLLLELSQVARASGVELSTIQPGQPSAAASATGFSTIPINLTVSGDFYSLTDLLYRLRSLVSVRDGELVTSGRLFSVETVGLSPANGGSGLSATVTVSAYVYGGAPPAPAAAPLPAVTDTTNTNTTATTTPAPAANVASGQ